MLLPILLIPSSPITSEIINFVVYCTPFCVSLSIFASNIIGSIFSPDLQLYIYHVNLELPSVFFSILGSLYAISPLLLLPLTYVNPCGNVTSAFNVTFSICVLILAFLSITGWTLYVATFSFLPRS